MRRQTVEPFPGDVREWDDRHANRDGLDRQDRLADVRAEVGLREHDDGRGAAVPRRRDVALQPAQAEVVVESGEQERRVDVRGEHLLLGAEAGALAEERAATREDRRDRRRVPVPLNAHPVADRGDRRADLVRVEQPAGGTRTELRVRGPHDVRTAMLRGDTSGSRVVFLQLLERGRPVGVPAELFQNGHSESPL